MRWAAWQTAMLSPSRDETVRHVASRSRDLARARHCRGYGGHLRGAERSESPQARPVARLPVVGVDPMKLTGLGSQSSRDAVRFDGPT